MALGAPPWGAPDVSLIFPSLGHLMVLAMTLVVAALCVGLGQFVGARRPPIALVAGWGLACVGLVVGGTITGASLNIAIVALGMVGAAGLVVVAQGSFDEGSWAATGRVLALAAPFLLIAAATGPSSPDEFSHWLPNLDYLYRHDHFPNLKTPSLGSERPGTPYAMAYVGYAVSLMLGRLAENAGIVWNALLLVAVGALCADILASQVRMRHHEDLMGVELTSTEEWGVAGIGLLAATMFNPSFQPRLFFTNGDDAPVGAVTGVAVAAIVMWLAAETRKSRDERLLLVAAIGFCCAALAQLRQDGLTLFALVFVAAVAATPLERQVGRRVNPMMLLLLLPPALLVALAWREYQAVQIPDEALAILRPADWHWAGLSSTLLSMLDVAIAKVGYSALLVLLLGFSLAIAEAPQMFTAFQRSGVVMGAVLGLGKVATLVVLYLVADYSAAEAAQAKEFWRFMVQIGPALVVGAIPLIPQRLWSERAAGRLLCTITPILALTLPIVSVRYLRVDQPRASHVPYLRQVARDLGGLIGTAPRITLVDPDDAAGDLASLAVVRYELQSGGYRRPRLQSGPPTPEVSFVAGATPTHLLADSGMPRDAARGYPAAWRAPDLASQLAAPFVWFRDGGAVASDLAGLTLPPGASYLVTHTDGHAVIAHTWPFPERK